MDHICPRGHTVRSAQDRDGSGHCLQCRFQWNATYRSRQSAAMALARALEDEYGIAVTRSVPPVDIAGLARALAAGYVTDDD